MINFKTFFVFLVLINTIVIHAKISNERLCANQECSELVALARTLILYNSPENGVLSFMPNVEAKIFSKSAGTRADLWGVEINGKRGYVPKNLLRETKILKQKLEFIMPTETNDDFSNNSATEQIIPSENTIINEKSQQENDPLMDQIVPDNVTPLYEVIDGTTIYLNSPDTSPDYYPVTTPSSNIVTDKLQQSESIQIETTLEPTLSVTPDPRAVYNNLNGFNVKEPDVKNIQAKNEIVLNGRDAGNLKDSLERSTEKFSSTGNIEDNVVDNRAVDDQSTEEGNKIEKKGGMLSSIKNFLFEDDDENSEEVEEDDYQDDENDDEDVDDDEQDIEDLSDTKGILTDGVSTELQSNIQIELNSTNINISNTHPDQSQSNKEIDISVASMENILPVSSNSNNNILPILPIVNDENLEQQSITPDIKSHNLSAENDVVIINKDNDTVISKQDDTAKEIETENIVTNIVETVNKEVVTVPNETIMDIEVESQNDKEIIAEVKTEKIIDYSQHVPSTLSDLLAPSDINDKMQELPSENVKQVPDYLENILVPASKKTAETTLLSEPNLHFTTELPAQDIDIPIYQNVVEPMSTEIPIKDAFQEIHVSSDEQMTESTLTAEIVDVSSEKIEEKTTNSALAEPELPVDIPIKIEENLNKDNKVNEDSGLFSKIYSGIFGSAEEIPSEENIVEILSDILPINDHLVTTEKYDAAIKNADKTSFEKHTTEKPFEKYLAKVDGSNERNMVSEQLPHDMQSCQHSESPSDCTSQSESIVSESLINDTGDEESWFILQVPENAYSTLLYLSFTAVTVLIFSLGHYYIEKKRIDSSLISNINALEKKLLVTSKENLILQDEVKLTKDRLISIEDSSFGSDEMVTVLKQDLDDAKNIRSDLEDQIVNLERELENATEAGMELNRMLTEFLSTQNGSENLMENVEHLQTQLIEQQSTINGMNSTLGSKNMENELLQTELSVANDKMEQLKAELDKMVVNLLSVQAEKSNIETELEEQRKYLKEEYDLKLKTINSELLKFKEDNNKLTDRTAEIQRTLELKNNEYSVLKESVKEVKAINSNKDSLKALLDVSKVKAEVQQLRDEKHILTEKLQSEIYSKLLFEKQVQIVMQEMQILKDKYDEADREKLEAQTRLDVLSTYFKDKEALLQKEINEHESMWVQKQGEATSTVERIKWIQEELQNYKSQSEILKKEILDQEVSLKSQISVLERKAHDNWVLARQAERKLEESKQEASQLRNRLTIVEKNVNNSTQAEENKMQSRMLQSMEANGDIVSPLHMGTMEAPGSPPLLYPHRDHITTSPIPGMPPFLPPPPPGVPFMPPPMPGVLPFMPPPPALFPGDHRPPPLGRMSSPPLHGRYSPDSRAYSPYDHDDSPSMSPSYADNDYRRGRSPPPPHGPRTYSPYSKGRTQWDDVRDYRDRPPQQRMPSRGHKGTGLSSGSGNSNESLDNSGRHSGRV